MACYYVTTNFARRLLLTGFNDTFRLLNETFFHMFWILATFKTYTHGHIECTKILLISCIVLDLRCTIYNEIMITQGLPLKHFVEFFAKICSADGIIIIALTWVLNTAHARTTYHKNVSRDKSKYPCWTITYHGRCKGLWEAKFLQTSIAFLD